MGRLVNAYRGTKKIKKCLINDKKIFSEKIVTRGLVDWFDFSDGKEKESLLKSRISDNFLRLNNFNFDSNSGWSGKGLNFDGIDDYIENINYSCEICLKIKKTENLYPIILGSSNADRITFRFFNDDDVDKIYYYDGSKIYYTFNSYPDYDFLVLNLTGWDLYVNGKKESDLLSFYKKINKRIGFNTYAPGTNPHITLYSIKFYNKSLTPEEIQQNYNYEQSIDRSTTMLLPEAPEEKSYMIGLSNQLSEEQLSTFRLSNNKEKFVCGLRYSENLIGELYTYSEIQKEMKKEEWCYQ
ncbi:MAG: hypothetical protein ACRC1M_03035 [Methanobacteriaceae archaeon]